MRDQLIQAGAEALHGDDGIQPTCEACLEDVAIVLDAFLGVLDANDEAWMEAARRIHTWGSSDIPNMTAVRRLLAVLRKRETNISEGQLRRMLEADDGL